MQLEGDTWRKNRKFSLATLKKLGLGSDVMTRAIHEEASEVVRTLKSGVGQESFLIDNQNFTFAMFKILWRIISKKRFQQNDYLIKKQIRELAAVFQLIPKIAFFSFIRHVSPDAIGLPRALSYYNG